MRVVFDTNALSNDSFDRLEASRIRDLVRQNRIAPVYGHVVLEELLRSYGSDRRRDDLLRRQLPFIAETAKYFCRDHSEIWHSELVQGRGGHACFYLGQKEFDRRVSQFRHAASRDFSAAWEESLRERREDDDKKKAQKRLAQKIREEYAAKLKEKPELLDISLPTIWRGHVQDTLKFAGRLLIESQVICRSPSGVVARWIKAPNNYPYFTSIVKNLLYQSFYAATKKDKLDENAQSDLDIMAHLLRAEILVSNEMGFMRTAFNDLWKPSGKVLMTTERFLNYIRNL